MRSVRLSVVLLAGLTIAATACDTTPHREQQALDQIHSGNAAACTEERANMEKAVQAYTLLNPDAPVTEAAMVSAGFIREQSVLMDVTSTGAVVAAPGSVCG